VRPERAAGEPASQEGTRLVSALELLGGSRVLRIEHKGEIYTLRVTRNDRLILTK
jgi:hemin uptake protein HemP